MYHRLISLRHPRASLSYAGLFASDERPVTPNTPSLSGSEEAKVLFLGVDGGERRLKPQQADKRK